MSRPWMPLYVADFVADTMHLSRANRGSYMSLICHYWRHGGLPRELALLQQIASIDLAEWETDGPILQNFFIVKDGRWVHKRIDKELQDADNKYEKRASAGRKGGLTKAKNKASNATAMLYQPQPQPHIESSLRSDSSASASKPAKNSSLEILKTVVSEKTAQDVVDHRKAGRQPLTPRAAEGLVAAFREHGDAEAAAEAMIVNGWRGFKSEWMANRSRAGPNGYQKPRVQNPATLSYLERPRLFDDNDKPITTGNTEIIRRITSKT